MSRSGIWIAVLCVVMLSFLCLAEQRSVGELAVVEAEPGAWAFYLGTWVHVDAFGAAHTFTFFEQGQYGVWVGWEKSDLLLGTATVATASEVIFFDSEGIEDRYGVVWWEEPTSALGVFRNMLEDDEEGNGQLLLTVYRYVSQGGLESSRDNIVISMVLTRQPEGS